MTTAAAQRPAAVRTWPCAICGHEIQKADGVDSRPTGRRFCRDENACRARVAARTTTMKEAGMPDTPEFVQEATAALAPPPDPTSARFAAAEAVLQRVARSTGTGVVATIVALAVDDVNDMPTAVRSHATIIRDDLESDPVAILPIHIAAMYALGRDVAPLDRSDDF